MYGGATFTQKNTDAIANVLNVLTFGLFFNESAVVTIDAEDKGVSGIADYELIFVANGSDVHSISRDSGEFTLNDEAIKEFKGSLYMIITDRAGNATERTQVTVQNSNLEQSTFMIENVAPTIDDCRITANGSALFDTQEYVKTNGVLDVVFTAKDTGSKLAAVEVTVNDTVTVTEKGMVTEKGRVLLSEQINENSNEADEKQFCVTLNPGDFYEDWNDGVFNVRITVCDNAGNVGTKDLKPIAVDQTAPVITGFDFDLANNIDVEKDEVDNLYQVVETDDYGFYFKEDVKVTVTAQDVVGTNETKAAGVQSVMVYLHDVDADVYYTVIRQGERYALITIKNLDDVGALTFEGIEEDDPVLFDFTVPANFKGQIYAKAIDNVTNEGGYVHPNGSVVESALKHEATSSIEIKAPEKTGVQNNKKNSFDDTNYNYGAFEGSFTNEDATATADYDVTQLVPLYNTKKADSTTEGEVKFEVTVTDEYSGIRKVEVFVINGSGDDELISTLEIGNDAVDDEDEWTFVEGATDGNLVTSVQSTVTVNGNNNDMVLVVKLTDRAGNESYDYYRFGMDVDSPTIAVDYNDDEAENDNDYTDFFRTDRTATVTVTERNFRAEDVVIEITNSENIIPVVGAWISEGDTHTAEIRYTADGDYTFAVAYTDNAGNANEVVNYGESIAPTKFTIDKTLPTVAVTYDNDSAQNGNYYKADRTATITIVEHNFDAKRVQILEAVPAISAWTSYGDTHTATITYNTDGKYTLDIEFMDMAGNAIDDFAAQEFYIDKTNPKLTISGIADRSANNGKGNIGFVVTATDENFDGMTPVLSAVVMEDGSFAAKNFTTLGNTEDIEKGQVYTVSNIGADGIYSITCTVVDKAGNAYSEVVLEDANGKTYVEKRSGNDTLVTFSVNRDGSTFALDTYTDELVKTYYVQSVTENVTIIEINADPIVENTVTLNGKALVENTDYTVSLENSAGSWYKYSYSVNKALFDGESEYNIVISSKDRASNEAFSDVKDVSVEFVVDRTAPIITVAGLKAGGRYQVEKQIVTLVPTDDGGSLRSLVVRTVDEDGKIIKELISLSGDELLDTLAAGNITFELSEGLYQNVQIICEDYAGNITGAETDEIYSNVSVSSSALMIFWANKPLRWGSISGVVLLAAAIIFFIVLKNRKKEAQK